MPSGCAQNGDDPGGSTTSILPFLAMTSELFDEITAALQAEKALLRQALRRVPDAPGMYALYGTAESVRQLGVPSPDPGLPLFVGKAERGSLRTELRDHVTTGRTLSSTVRRSLAALLHERLGLRIAPYAGDSLGGRVFALVPDSEQRLTDWMDAHLRIATWAKPQGTSLAGVDREVVAAFRPPLVLRGAGRPWLRLHALRTQLATEARRAAELRGAAYDVRSTGWAPAAGRAANHAGAVQPPV
jgi:hypothetical protein